jgi:hypothetical protein
MVPYAVFGVGDLTHVANTATATFTSSGSTQEVSLQVPGGTDLAVNFGGGLRYYLNPRYGFRVEAKAYKPTGQFNQVFGKAEFGFFIQLRKRERAKEERGASDSVQRAGARPGRLTRSIFKFPRGHSERACDSCGISIGGSVSNTGTIAVQ